MAPAPEKKSDDVEAQLPAHHLSSGGPQADLENRVSGVTKISYLAVYFLCNISLTIYNKLILGKVSPCSSLHLS